MRINLYSGPGVGKSLLAAYLFDSLARCGLRIELTREAIKPMAYRRQVPDDWGNKDVFDAQLQAERDWLEGGVPHLVTDSPLLLGCYYMAARSAAPTDGCLDHARRWERQHPSLNLFLKRSDLIGYQQAGRYQDRKEADRIDAALAAFLRGEGVEVFQFDAHERNDILDFVRVRLFEADATVRTAA